METFAEAEVRVGTGVGTDSRGSPGRRQVTVLSHEAWTATCNELNAELPWTLRRANLLVEGLKLKETVGGVLRLGDVTLEITGETDPCFRMDEQHEGLTVALTPDWRGGVICRVVSAGHIRVGDTITMDATEAP